MTVKADILSRFSGAASEGPLYVPDLTLWYDWHHSRGTFPDRWKHHSLPQIARDLGAPAWLVARPWRIETPGIEIQTTEQDGERVTRSETPEGSLIARWTLGSDGTWWQTEYPVKTAEDLEAALELVNSQSYILDVDELARLETVMGDEGLLALEIPGRPYADLLYEFLGLSEGPILLSEDPPAVRELIAILETKLQGLVQEVATLPGSVIFSPDNLDGQFISPTVFQEFLADSYRLTAEVLHRHGKYLLIHAGGPIRPLLTPLVEAGVDGVEGIAGPPQSDVSLSQARAIVGPEFTLWGGIPQDFLLAAHDRQAFETAVVQAAQEAREDGRLILGVADRVPIDSELHRLEGIPSLVERALSG